MLKRAGRGHDPAGIDATKLGECAVLCPACPQPGMNLPKGWEDAPPDVQLVLHSTSDTDFLFYYRWLYALFLALDANFRMTRKNVMNDKSDPSLT
jgi:hypothetical protein